MSNAAGWLLLIVLIVVMFWARSSAVQHANCPQTVAMAGHTVACDGAMPSPDSTGAGR